MNDITTDEMREDYIWRNRPRPAEETAAEFDAWLGRIKRAARSDGYEDGHEIGYESGWEIGYEAGREGIMSQMGDRS